MKYSTTYKPVDFSLDTGGRSVSEAEQIIAKGHPPEADKRILIDFDATLYPFGYLFDAPAPIEGAVEFMQNLKAKGYTIGIFTSRLSTQWLNKVQQTAAQHIVYITSVCTRDKIPFDFITAEKIPSEMYIDDKAIRFENNWQEIWDTYFKGVE